MKQCFRRMALLAALILVCVYVLPVSASQYNTADEVIAAVPEGNQNLFPANCSTYGTNGIGMETSSLSGQDFTNLDYKADGTILYNAPKGLTYEDSFIMRFKMTVLDRDNGEGGANGHPESCSARIIFRSESINTHLSLAFFPTAASILYTNNNKFEGFENTPFMIEENRRYDVAIMSEPTVTTVWIDNIKLFTAENTPSMDISKAGVCLHFSSLLMEGIEIYSLSNDPPQAASAKEPVLPGNTLTGENHRNASVIPVALLIVSAAVFTGALVLLVLLLVKKRKSKKVGVSSDLHSDDFPDKNKTD